MRLTNRLPAAEKRAFEQHTHCDAFLEQQMPHLIRMQHIRDALDAAQVVHEGFTMKRASSCCSAGYCNDCNAVDII